MRNDSGFHSIHSAVTCLPSKDSRSASDFHANRPAQITYSEENDHPARNDHHRLPLDFPRSTGRELAISPKRPRSRVVS